MEKTYKAFNKNYRADVEAYVIGSTAETPVRSYSGFDFSGMHTSKWAHPEYAPEIAVSPRDYLDPADPRLCFDESHCADPIGINGIAEHYAEMSQLNRMISQECYGGSKVSKMQPALGNEKLFWQKQEWIAKKLATDFATADKLIEAFKSLDLRTKEVMWCIEDILKEGLHAGFVKYTKLAQLAVNEPEEQEDVWVMNEVERIEQYLADISEDEDDEDLDLEIFTEQEELLLEEEEEMDQLELFPTEQYIPIGDDYEVFDDLGRLSYNNDTYDEWANISPDKRPWLRNQPRWYQRVVDEMYRLNEKELSNLGKRFYNNSDKLTPTQVGVFWTTFRNHKRKLERRTKSSFIKLLKFLKACSWSLGRQRKYIYELQNAKGRLHLSNKQWSCIWKVVKRTPSSKQTSFLP